MAQLGFVTRQNDGSYEGYLKTLSINAPIRIIANDAKMPEANEPDYRVMFEELQIGTASYTTNLQGDHYTLIRLAVPEFGPRLIYAKLSKPADKKNDDDFVIVWYPAD